jgi:hypothetical protein
MMGQNSSNQNRLFYSFNIEDHVPTNHLLRGIDQFLDLADLRTFLAPFSRALPSVANQMNSPCYEIPLASR